MRFGFARGRAYQAAWTKLIKQRVLIKQRGRRTRPTLPAAARDGAPPFRGESARGERRRQAEVTCKPLRTCQSASQGLVYGC